MSIKKDKQKVLGEFFDDTRIQSFLDQANGGHHYTDYQLLEKAYRGMIAENFATFVRFFIDAGKNVNATNTYGESFLQSIRTHQQAGEYITALQEHGAV